MKLILLFSTLLSVWSVKMMANGNSYRYQSPYSGDCGVQLTRGKGGGIYYAFGASSYGSTAGTAASNIRQNVASTSSSNDNSDYYGSYGNYGNGAGRYPSSSVYGSSGGSYGSQASTSGSGGYGSSSSSVYSQANGGSYGNGYGSSVGSGYDGAGSGWSQSASSYDNDARFTADVLYSHNSYRARHNTPPVTLDKLMSQKAQQWAEEMAAGRADYGHSPEAVEGIYGESLQVVSNASPSGVDVMERWYDEMDNYDYKIPLIVRKPFNKRNSHFTAMVWYGTRKIGVGKATSPISGKSFIVVTYYPPGNNVDVLESNVFPPKRT